LADSELDRHTGYRPEFKFHDENLQMLSWYAERLVDALKRSGARSLVSLGIGHQVVSRRLLESLSGTLDQYTIVEGSAARIAELKETTTLPPFVHVEHSYFESFVAPRPVDAIEMGFVLEHVDDPEVVLRRFAGFLRPGGLLVVVVPNARSLHRLFGHAAGLLDDVYRLSPEDLELGHQRYFDLAALRRLVEDAGLRIVTTEGVFLKCLTTGQLQRLALPPEIAKSFFTVGASYPEIANAIYLETTR
jgi:SAM-dependent methyltransferase